MSDLVEDVKRAIWVHRCRQELGEPICDVNDIDESYDWKGTAEAAIDAATPHIRAALFDELIAEAYGDDWDIPSKRVADWLRALKEGIRI